MSTAAAFDEVSEGAEIVLLIPGYPEEGGLVLLRGDTAALPMLWRAFAAEFGVPQDAYTAGWDEAKQRLQQSGFIGAGQGRIQPVNRAFAEWLVKKHGYIPVSARLYWVGMDSVEDLTEFR